MHGSKRSFIFWRIGKSPQTTYFSDFSQAGEDAILNDLLSKIYRSSQIANKKYDLIRTSMILFFISIPPWFLYMITGIYQNFELSN